MKKALLILIAAVSFAGCETDPNKPKKMDRYSAEKGAKIFYYSALQLMAKEPSKCVEDFGDAKLDSAFNANYEMFDIKD